MHSMEYSTAEEPMLIYMYIYIYILTYVNLIRPTRFIIESIKQVIEMYHNMHHFVLNKN